MESRCPRALALGAIAALLLCLVPAARGDAPTIEDFTGAWSYADGEAGRERVDEAIEHAIDPMPFFAEPIARERVEARVGPFDQIELWWDGRRLTFTADDWGPVTGPLGGEAAPITGPAGSELMMSQRLRRGRLVQRFEADGARRVNRLALSGDRSTLWMSVSLSSADLPRDASYRLRYRRAR